MTSIPHVVYREQQGPLEILHLEPGLQRVERHEVLNAIRKEYPGAHVSLVGDEIAVSYWRQP